MDMITTGRTAVDRDLVLKLADQVIAVTARHRAWL